MVDKAARPPDRSKAALQATHSTTEPPGVLLSVAHSLRQELLRRLSPAAIVQELLAAGEKSLLQFLERVQSNLDEGRASIESTLRSMNASLETAMITLAQLGWYVDMWIITQPAVVELAQQAKEGRVDEVEQYLVSFYSNHLERIEEELLGRHPDRAPMLRQACAAHRRGEYALSIPVFLAQADGVCHDRIGEQVYRRRSGNPAIAHVLAAMATGILAEAVLAPLKSPMPISDSTDDSSTPGRLNRHAILHGLDLSYHTQHNSLKALLFLLYVSDVLDKQWIDESAGD